jgi:hypothetical protein
MKNSKYEVTNALVAKYRYDSIIALRNIVLVKFHNEEHAAGLSCIPIKTCLSKFPSEQKQKWEQK